MSDKDSSGSRRRMVVEEVSPVRAEVVSNEEPLEDIKRGVEELQDITEHISEDVKESAEVQEEIVEAAEKVDQPTFQPPVLPSTTVEPLYPPKRSTGVNPLIIIIPGVLLLGALLGGIVFYQKSVGENPIETPIVTEENSTVSSPVASATLSATVDLTKYTVNIFNGSGTPGEAGKVKDLITAAGFKAGTTGNAATYDFTKTIIKAKDTVDAAFTAKLSETLAKNYVVDKVQTLDSTSKNDVEVIVGSSKAQ